MDISIAQFLIFLVVFVRITTILTLIPILGSQGVPMYSRLGLALLLSVILFPVIRAQKPEIPQVLVPLTLTIGEEVLIGLVIGFVTNLIFIGVQTSGQLVGLQIGFNIVNVIDPLSNLQVSIIEQFQHLIALLIFLAIDGHHFLLQALAKSFEIIPISGFELSGLAIQKLIRMTSNVFVIAIKIGAPVIAALFLTSVAMAIIARTVPQMNIFIVGLPLKIGVGLFILAFSLPFFLYVFRKLFLQLQSDVGLILKLLHG